LEKDLNAFVAREKEGKKNVVGLQGTKRCKRDPKVGRVVLLRVLSWNVAAELAKSEQPRARRGKEEKQKRGETLHDSFTCVPLKRGSVLLP